MALDSGSCLDGFSWARKDCVVCNISSVWIWPPNWVAAISTNRVTSNSFLIRIYLIPKSFLLLSTTLLWRYSTPLCNPAVPWHAPNYTEYKQLTKWNLPHSGGRIQFGLDPFLVTKRGSKSLLEIWTATISKLKNLSMSLNAELSKREKELLPLSLDLLIRVSEEHVYGLSLVLLSVMKWFIGKVIAHMTQVPPTPTKEIYLPFVLVKTDPIIANPITERMRVLDRALVANRFIYANTHNLFLARNVCLCST